MKQLVVLCALASSGCATSWLVVQASGSPLAIADHHREELVPKPGVEEHLRIAVPLVLGSGPATIRCTTEQVGTSARYASELHYGHTWNGRPR